MNKYNANKNSLASSISKQLGLPSTMAIDLINQTLELIVKNIKEDGKVQIPNFGNFVKKEKKSRKGRNIKENVEVIIKPREIMVFHSSDHLKDKINENK